VEYLEFGKSGLKVSTIGIGMLQAGGYYGTHDDDECVRAIVRASELGINLVDTAEAYGDGHSEEVVGEAMREIGRDKLVIATKVHGRLFATCHLRYRDVLRACEASLNRLGISQIDLYQVHFPNPWEQIPLKETMRAMEELYRSGKIRAIGVSNFAVRDLKEAQDCLRATEIVSNQVQYNLIRREIEEEVVPYCRKENISVLAWGPLEKGALTGKYTPENTPKDQVRGEDIIFSNRNMPQVMKLVSKLKEIGDVRGKSPGQVALNWLMTHAQTIPIPGAKRPQQAEENAGAAGWQLSPSELDQIQQALDQLSFDYF